MKRKWRWVSRDTVINESFYWIWSNIKPPKWNEMFHEFRDEQSDLLCVCASEFTACTGLTIKPGECVKVIFGKARIVK